MKYLQPSLPEDEFTGELKAFIENVNILMDVSAFLTPRRRDWHLSEFPHKDELDVKRD